MNFRKNSNGITLIALVITIIVMLILVGVTLSMISGENGILEKAEKAVDKTNEASVKEDIELAISDKTLEYYKDYDNLSVRYPKAVDYVKAQLKYEAQTNAGATLWYDEESGKFKYTKDGQGANVNIDENGNVSIGDLVEEPEKPVQKYTVTYDANSGDGSVPTDSKEYAKGEIVTVGFSTLPTKIGYQFLGWTDDSSNKTNAKYTLDGTTTFAMSDGNVTLYAVWDISTYTVSFDANGGTCSTASKSVTYHSNYGELPTPTRTNCDFVGWYTNKKINSGTKIEDNSNFTLSSDQTLYAVWSHTHTASGNLISGTALADDGAYGTSGGCYTSEKTYTQSCGGTYQVTNYTYKVKQANACKCMNCLMTGKIVVGGSLTLKCSSCGTVSSISDVGSGLNWCSNCYYFGVSYSNTYNMNVGSYMPTYFKGYCTNANTMKKYECNCGMTSGILDQD